MLSGLVTVLWSLISKLLQVLLPHLLVTFQYLWFSVVVLGFGIAALCRRNKVTKGHILTTWRPYLLKNCPLTCRQSTVCNPYQPNHLPRVWLGGWVPQTWAWVKKWWGILWWMMMIRVKILKRKAWLTMKLFLTKIMKPFKYYLKMRKGVACHQVSKTKGTRPETETHPNDVQHEGPTGRKGLFDDEIEGVFLLQSPKHWETWHATAPSNLDSNPWENSAKTWRFTWENSAKTWRLTRETSAKTWSFRKAYSGRKGSWRGWRRSDEWTRWPRKSFQKCFPGGVLYIAHLSWYYCFCY